MPVHNRPHLALAALIISVVLVGCVPPAAEEDATGTVVRVLDGDSIRVASSQGQRLEVRLAEIDAPEKDQPHSEAAKEALSDLVLGKAVAIEVLDVDQYGRFVARVYRADDELSVNRALVSEGHAWVYRRHLRDSSLLDLQSQAQQARRGLWALPADDIVPPWQWRRTHSTVHRR